jgi:hypothetical protein
MAGSVRFSLRQLCTALLVFALLFAMLSPIVRAWNTAWQTFFLVYGAILLGGMGLVLLFLCRGRYRLERQAGPLLLRTDARPDRRMRIKQALSIVFWLAWIVSQWWLAASVNAKPNWRDLYAMLVVGGLWGTFLIPRALTKVWWGTGFSTIEICENGLIVAGFRFVAWKTIRKGLRRYYWSSFAPHRLVIVQRFRTWQMEVAPRHRAAVEDLFAVHLGHEPVTAAP